MLPAQLLKFYTDILLSDTSTWIQKRDCLQDMHKLFIDLGAIDAYAGQFNDEIWLDTGCAISPKGAAFCLFEISRTRLFVLGLIDAIRDLIVSGTEIPVETIDAGCGPYALLSLLASLYFSEKEARFTLLDIHAANIESARKLIIALGAENKFPDLLVEDACTYQWPRNKRLHIVVSETMLNGLRKEPQVSVVLNLASQLAENGILIPEKIEVDLAKDKGHGVPGEKLANIITLAKESLPKYFDQEIIASHTLGQQHNPQTDCLSFATTITVYKDYAMQHNDSSLTAPLPFSQPHKNALKAGTTIDFRYENGSNPGIKHKISDYAL